MKDEPGRESRLRLLRDVIVFQVKLGMEAVLDVTLIPVSLAAAGLDLLLGNWRRPRWFHAVLRFGERCEQRINLWGIATPGAESRQSEIDVVIRSIETVISRPATGPEKLRELRRWAATKIAPGDDDDPQSPGRSDSSPG